MELASLGTTPFISSSAEFGKFIADETQKWAKVVKFAGARPVNSRGPFHKSR
jgi:tripartite-type tricarboxylate transporter receptor subunit TctC